MVDWLGIIGFILILFSPVIYYVFHLEILALLILWVVIFVLLIDLKREIKKIKSGRYVWKKDTWLTKFLLKFYDWMKGGD